jgi:hypothetical protein
MAIQLHLDEQKNRLYLTLTGLMTDAEMRVAADQTIEVVKKLRKGFTVLNDISQFRPMTKDGVNEVARVGVFCAQHGMRATARVVGISPTAHQQFQRVAKENGYTAYTAQSVEEAEALLDAHKD